MEKPLIEITIEEEQDSAEMPYSLLLLADPSIEAIEDYVHRGYCYRAILNDEVIGIYILIKTRPKTVELVNIAVSEAYQGKGIGRSLIKDAIKRSKFLGAKHLEVGTGNSSIGQLALYQKCGFKIVGIDRDFFLKHYPDKIIENGIQCTDMIRLKMDLE